MPLDLRQFEKLDTYASQVREQTPLCKVAWRFPSQDNEAFLRVPSECTCSPLVRWPRVLIHIIRMGKRRPRHQTPTQDRSPFHPPSAAHGVLTCPPPRVHTLQVCLIGRATKLGPLPKLSHHRLVSREVIYSLKRPPCGWHLVGAQEASLVN